ncbi:hypothetical protein MFLO_02383 [Listeria floridensis FSL S10-1187]|uniref:Uncharacterized protein n=1 Tax=Listeria floridensis FSL S10-1187 TaxID=1265817 RepID=A0ABN0RHZ8_9LIST|nr:hypothetical protein [Listeria floridensis]EUJ33513.1 hypothetical protein MFLO_02383 [Listeria floridensis FSL S10-1187]
MDFKQAYEYDVNGIFLRDALIFEDENGEFNLPPLHTFVAPQTPSINPIFDEDEGRWSLGEEPEPIKEGELSEMEQLRQDGAEILLYLADVENMASGAQQDHADLLLSLVEAGVL